MKRILKLSIAWVIFSVFIYAFAYYVSRGEVTLPIFIKANLITLGAVISLVILTCKDYFERFVRWLLS